MFAKNNEEWTKLSIKQKNSVAKFVVVINVIFSGLILFVLFYGKTGV